MAVIQLSLSFQLTNLPLRHPAQFSQLRLMPGRGAFLNGACRPEVKRNGYNYGLIVVNNG
jgi:hypothetical protein